MGAQFVPISTNDKMTAILKDTGYDYSILSKTLFSRWFGENTSIDDVVKEMVHYQSERYQSNVPMAQSPGGDFDNLTIISVGMRNKINEIIHHYDNNYIWYSNFIVDRMSRHLLIDP